MKPYTSLKSVLSEFFALHRTLASADQDKTLEIVGSYMPDSSKYTIENYAPLTPVWTWKVPERYVVHEAYLEIETSAEQSRSDGGRIVDFKDNPLHIVSYSLPVDKVLAWDELQPHLYFNEKRPNAVPWIFKYYERDWGFCLPKNIFDKLPRDRRFHAVIKAEFTIDPKQGFKVASAVIHPQGGPNPAAGEIIVLSHTCHPMQANDDGAGVVSAIELARRLAEKPLPAGSMSVRFWFGPETIGTIAYLAHNEALIPNLRGGIFLEMTGNQNKIAWHHTRQHTHLLDRITNQVLRDVDHDERDFASAPANDERVINGPGVNVPCISLNRWPYEEYHTTDDNLAIVHEEMLVGASDVAEQIIRMYASNYIPRRMFRGPVFLSGNGLWVDWRENWELNRAIEKIMMRLEGGHSLFDIAEQVGLDYWVVRAYVEKFRAKGFIVPLPIPSEAQAA
jgi:aminopeptidase-like protein